jgi:hypothetical protein
MLMLRRTVLAAAVLVLGSAACGGDDSAPPAEAEREPLAFTGTVERVDTVGRTVTVANDDVPGWMSPMSMVYQLDRPEMVSQLQPGNRVRATVYAGDFATLYAIEIVQP